MTRDAAPVSQASIPPAAPNAQAVRDTRRVLQVLLPGLPPPAIEMACNTFFASTSLTQRRGTNRSSSMPSNSRKHSERYTIKRMDSGDFSQLSLTSPLKGNGQSKHFEDTSQLQFNMPDMMKSKR